MPKLVVALFLFAIGTVIWALQPADKEAASSSHVSSPSESNQAKVGSDGKSKTLNRRIAKDRVTNNKMTPKTRTGTAIPRRAHAELVREREEQLQRSKMGQSARSPIPPGAKVNRPWPVYLPGEPDIDYDKNPEPKYVRPKDESPFPSVTTAAFKDSVRRYYGGLPASGRAPGRVMAADVLPPAIVSGLKMPPNSELKMLGPYNMDHDNVFKNALDSPDDGQVIFGVSFETPSGEQQRKYIRLEGTSAR